jgi:hypothetical protein
MRPIAIALTLGLAASATAACDDATSTGSAGPEAAGPDEKAAGEAADPSGKDTLASAGYKADCLDCDPEGPNALTQLGLRGEFWKVNDRWQVAYLMRADTRVQMQDMPFQAEIKPEAGYVVLDFKVAARGTASIGGRERDTATLEITQGQARGSVSQLITPEKTLAVTEVVERMELVLDDLLRPVSVTSYSGPRGDFPNGLTVQFDPRNVVRSLDASFPYVVPNAYLNAEKVSLPELPETLAAIAEATSPGYRDRQYFHFDLAGRGLDSGEQVYWAAGEPWPFLVITPSATGVLVAR